MLIVMKVARAAVTARALVLLLPEAPEKVLIAAVLIEVAVVLS